MKAQPVEHKHHVIEKFFRKFSAFYGDAQLHVDAQLYALQQRANRFIQFNRTGIVHIRRCPHADDRQKHKQLFF